MSALVSTYKTTQNADTMINAFDILKTIVKK